MSQSQREGIAARVSSVATLRAAVTTPPAIRGTEPRRSGTLDSMQGSGGRWKLGHRPALDGVRGLAVLLVLACHLAIPGMDGAGAVGVTVFFVLSGFLITGLVLEEHDRTSRISFRRFYGRRARRLLPALIASTAAVVALSPLLGPAWFEWSDLPAVLFYYGNWVEADPTQALGGLAGTWSLAVEEQFYILWPLLLLPLARMGRRIVMLAALLGVTLSALDRIVLIQSGAPSDRVYYGSDTVALALLAGAALVAWRGSHSDGRPSRLLVPVGVALIAVPCAWSALTAAYLALPVAAAGTVLLILGVTGTTRLRILESRVLVWFGQRSYGLYLWHCALGMWLRVGLGWSWPALVAVMLPASLLLAEASYRWVEAPWRSKAGRGHANFVIRHTADDEAMSPLLAAVPSASSRQ